MPDIQDLAEMVERQIQQMARLIEDLLDVSRVGHGKVNLRLKKFDLRAVAEFAIEVSRP